MSTVPTNSGAEPAKDRYQRAWSIFCRLLPILLAAIELAGCIFINWITCMEFHYPRGSTLAPVLTILFLIPAVLTLVLPVIHRDSDRLRKLRRIAAILCVVCLLPSLFFSMAMINRSETDDIMDYRRFDVNCLAGRSPMLQDLFPLWAPTEAESRYYYRYLCASGFDDTFDVYAEWTLSADSFSEEVERAKAAMEEHASNGPVSTLQKGPWTCLFYSDMRQTPFESPHNSYDYSIFAYDPVTLRVRYLDGFSLEDGACDPYYLRLSWD